MKQFFESVLAFLKVAAACLIVALLGLAVGYMFLLYAQTHSAQTPMTFKEKMNLAQVGVMTVGLASLVLVGLQLRSTSRWNKRLSFHQFFKEVPELPKKEKFSALADKLNIDDVHLGSPLSKEGAKSIHDDKQAQMVVMDYLNDFEEFAFAVRSGLVDDTYAYTLEQCRVMRAWVVFEPWVMELRKTTMYANAYKQLELLAKMWLKRAKKKGQSNVPQI